MSHQHGKIEQSSNEKVVAATNEHLIELHILHPFKNDVILKNLFDYCDLKDLLLCRLVSKKWYKLSLSQWLRLQDVTTLLSSSNSIYLKNDLLAFLRMFHNDFHVYDEYEYAGVRQLQKFSLHDLNLISELPMLNFFYQKCGENITHVDIDLKFQSLETFEAIMLSKFTPNLIKLVARSQWSQKFNGDLQKISNKFGAHKKLESLLISSYNCDDRSMPKEAWLAIFQRYSRLITLEYVMDNDVNKTKLNQMMESACQVRKEFSGLQILKCFNVSKLVGTSETTSQLPFLRKHFIQLDTLGICVADQHHNECWDLLCLQANSLQKLILHNCGRRTFEHFQIPRMPLVHTLQIFGIPFSRIGFLKGFENLRSLLIYNDFGGYHESLNFCGDIAVGGIVNLVFPALTKLRIFQEYLEKEKPFCKTVIRKLQNCFPNVRDLQMFLSNDTLREVCNGWSHIEHLDIIGNLVDDEGITGLLGGGEVASPSNTNLKDLMSFKYTHPYFEENTFPQYFTKASITNGLLKLRNLQSIELSFPIEIDAEVWMLLKKNNVVFKSSDYFH